MLRHALLGLLRGRAQHGYRLWARLDALLGPAWRVSLAQVYQALDGLRREGFVEEVNGETASVAGRERRPVAITRSGSAELERWIARPARSFGVAPPVRSEVLIRLVVSGPKRPCDVLDRLATERQAYESERRRIEEEAASVRRPGSPAALALEAERLRVLAHLAWLEHCQRALSPAPEHETESPGARTQSV